MWHPETKAEAREVLSGLVLLARSKGDPAHLTTDERESVISALRCIKRRTIRPS